jgi:PIN domain nuclease of toxin-antitoxin system
MKLLMLDTQLAIWTGSDKTRMSASARALIGDPANQLFFSSVTIWEIAIKQALRRSGFFADADFAREQMLAAGFQEVPLTGIHAVKIRELPPLHGDPFNRILIAQAMCEGLTLLTTDSLLAQYPGPVLRV